MSSTKSKLMFLVTVLALGISLAAGQSNSADVRGIVLDPMGLRLAGAKVDFKSTSGMKLMTETSGDGEFDRSLPGWGIYSVHVEAAGFAPLTLQFELKASTGTLHLRLEQAMADAQTIVVSTEMGQLPLDS